MGGSSAGSSGSADAPTTKRSTVTQVRKSTGQKVVDFVKGGGFMGMAVRTVKGAIDKRNPRSNINDPTGLYAEGLTTGSRNNNNTSGGEGGNDNPIPVATNVGGKIIIAPSTAGNTQDMLKAIQNAALIRAGIGIMGQRKMGESGYDVASRVLKDVSADATTQIAAVQKLQKDGGFN